MKRENSTSAALWPRVSLVAYAMVMAVISAVIVAYVFAPSGMVRIDDREAVMRRRTSNILTSLTIESSCWPQVTVTDQDFLFALGQRINSIPRVSGEYPGEAPGRITGRMEFADGSREDFAAGTVLTVGRAVYYSQETQEELRGIRDELAAQLYTLGNLASFFRTENQATLADETTTIPLASDQMALVGQAIGEGELVEDLAEAGQTVGDRPPRYTLTVRDGAGVELLRLLVYGNESTQVYDSYAPGQQLVLCFSGDLIPLCQGLLEG